MDVRAVRVLGQCLNKSCEEGLCTFYTPWFAKSGSETCDHCMCPPQNHCFVGMWIEGDFIPNKTVPVNGRKGAMKDAETITAVNFSGSNYKLRSTTAFMSAVKRNTSTDPETPGLNRLTSSSKDTPGARTRRLDDDVDEEILVKRLRGEDGNSL